MSLVEKAIKRLAESRKNGTASSPANVSAAQPYGAPQESRADVQSPQPQGPTRALDFAALRAMGMLPLEQERKAFSQAYRGIKRPILANLAQRDLASPESARASVVMIASAVSGDGKTFTAINLALSLALEKDKHVVLIDGDVVKRELSRCLGFGDDPGLIELLEDPSRQPERYVIQTDLSNLTVLPAGRTSIHATELLSSSRMHALIGKFAINRDLLVIIDSPPLMLTTESRAIAEVAGQAVLVVREGKTTHDMVRSALSLLQVCPRVSLIINQSIAQPNDGYGYGYGAKNVGTKE